MLVCLEERGYIAQSPGSERYHLTLHLFRLAQEHPPIKRMTMQALPIMQQVAHELCQSCHLGVLNGDAGRDYRAGRFPRESGLLC